MPSGFGKAFVTVPSLWHGFVTMVSSVLAKGLLMQMFPVTGEVPFGGVPAFWASSSLNLHTTLGITIVSCGAIVPLGTVCPSYSPDTGELDTLVGI